MNNVNTINKIDYPKKSTSWKNLGYAVMLSGLLNASTPTYAHTNISKDTTEQVDSKTDKLNGIKLPTIYKNKLDDFLTNNTVMKDCGTKSFTMDFVSKEMESDRGISKEHQLLFIRHAIYKQTTEKDLYDGQDGDQNILDDFNVKTVNLRIKVCGQKFQNKVVAYMNERSADAEKRSAQYKQESADAEKRSADAQQRSADAIKNIMHTDSVRIRQHMQEFYDIYIRNPDIVKKEEIDFMKKSAKEIIASCKKHGIDYRDILLKEVGDKKKVDEILKFYGIEQDLYN